MENWTQMEPIIREYIYDKLKEEEIDAAQEGFADKELVDSREISSLFLIELIAGVEEILEFPVVTDDVNLMNFTSVNRMIASAHEAFEKRQKTLE